MKMRLVPPGACAGVDESPWRVETVAGRTWRPSAGTSSARARTLLCYGFGFSQAAGRWNTGSVNAPALTAGDLRDEHIVSVVMGGELWDRGGVMGVDLHGMPKRPRTILRPVQSTAGQVRCKA